MPDSPRPNKTVFAGRHVVQFPVWRRARIQSGFSSGNMHPASSVVLKM
jgi:hypothetical protein